MKHIKIISTILVIVVASSVLAGCNFLIGSVNDAERVYARYNQIVDDFTVRQDGNIVAEESLFNANSNLFITYKDTNFRYEMNSRPDSVFNVFGEEYPETLYSALSFFNQYRVSLSISSNEWNADNISNIYLALLDFESALSRFNTQKIAIENITIANYPYTATIMVQYNSFLSAYNNLLEKTIDLARLFEQAYTQDIINADNFLNVMEVPYHEVRRLSYTSSVYMAEAVYNYYVKHIGSFNEEGVSTLLYDSMYDIRQNLRNLTYNEGSISGWDVEHYRVTRAHEKQMITQSEFYVTAIRNAQGLEGASSGYDYNLYNDYVATINEVTANYNNYASYVLYLLENVGA